MRYFVLSGDGSKYGPADVPTLNSWITEGRLLPGTMLEEEGSGTQMVASAVAGLNFPSAQAVSGPQGSIYSSPPGQGGPTQGPVGQSYTYTPPTDDGKGLVIASWILGGVGLVTFCCWIGFICIIIGIILAVLAKQKGNEKAQAPLIFNVVVFVICAIIMVSLAAAGKSIQNWSQSMQQQQIKASSTTTG